MTHLRWYIGKGPDAAPLFLASWRSEPRVSVEWTPHLEDAFRFQAKSIAMGVAEHVAKAEGLDGVEVLEAEQQAAE